MPEVPAWHALDPAVADILRPTLPAVTDDVLAAVRAAVPEYEAALRDGGGGSVRAGVGQALEGFVELLARRGGVAPPLDEVACFGRAAARAGTRLDAMLCAYRTGARVAWRGFADAGDRAGLPPAVLYALAEAIFAYIDELSAAGAEGHAAEQRAAAGARDEDRRRLLEQLLRDPPLPADVLERAALAVAWPLPRTVAVLAYTGADERLAARRLPADVLDGPAPTGARWAVVPDPGAPGRHAALAKALERVPAALGPVVAPREAGRSAARAALALRTVAEPRGPGLVLAEDHLLDLVLLQDATLAGELAGSRLAPLDDLGPQARDRFAATLLAWIDAHGDVRAAADALCIHTQTLRYRLGRLRELFGDDLDDPDRRLELALALRVCPPAAHLARKRERASRACAPGS